MQDKLNYQNILNTFANVGFKKASMAQLAKAAGVTRQTLYNRFQNKEAVLDHALLNFIEESREDALKALFASPENIHKGLMDCFYIWAGSHVDMLHQAPFGFEIMDLAAASMQRLNVQPHLGFEASLKDFLIQTKTFSSEKLTDDFVFTINAASKGLMIKSASSAAYNEAFDRILTFTLSIGEKDNS